ncbi:MAG: hypothetical protein OXD46_09630 [Chloroflexi bacterium]|nr:hypothetical protein [Chloroflexota bacterium]
MKLPFAWMADEVLIAVPEVPLSNAPLTLRISDEPLQQVRLPKDGQSALGPGVRRFVSETPLGVSAPVCSS